MYQPLTDFGEVGSALAQTSFSARAKNNFEQELDLASKSLRLAALEKANEWQRQVQKRSGQMPQIGLGQVAEAGTGILGDVMDIVGKKQELDKAAEMAEGFASPGLIEAVQDISGGPNIFEELGQGAWQNSLPLMTP